MPEPKEPPRRCSNCAYLQFHAQSPDWKREGPMCVNPKGPYFEQAAQNKPGCRHWTPE